MLEIEILQQELDALLNECHRIHWKNLELEILIQYANHGKKVWEDNRLDYAVNNMFRIIEMAESLNRLREESKTNI